MRKKVSIFLFVVSFLFLLLIPQTMQAEQPFDLCDLTAVDMTPWAAISESFDGSSVAIDLRKNPTIIPDNESFLANHYAISESIHNMSITSNISQKQETAIKPLTGKWTRGEVSTTLKKPFFNGSFNNLA